MDIINTLLLLNYNTSELKYASEIVTFISNVL
jgi:hypothetical protein